MNTDNTLEQRPKIKDFFGENVTLTEVMETYHSQPELFNYAQALDHYIDELESKQPSPAPVEGERENIFKEVAQWVIDHRYPKSENDKVSDFEMYNTIIDKLKPSN